VPRPGAGGRARPDCERGTRVVRDSPRPTLGKRGCARARAPSAHDHSLVSPRSVRAQCLSATRRCRRIVAAQAAAAVYSEHQQSPLRTPAAHPAKELRAGVCMSGQIARCRQSGCQLGGFDPPRWSLGHARYCFRGMRVGWLPRAAAPVGTMRHYRESDQARKGLWAVALSIQC
jgi:hypothetical protein